MNKKKKISIITIIAVIVIIIGAIVGISINKHNTAVKEALSVSESKEYVFNSFEDEYKSIVDKEYKTAEEYKSAVKDLVALKYKINVSDIKEDERLVTIVSNIDKTIEEYDAKIKDLTTTVTTTEAITEPTTEKETEKPVNAPKRNSGSSNNTDTNSNKSKNPTKDTSKENTKTKTTAKQTTTSNKITPAYGTVIFNSPNDSKYIIGHWHTIDFIWYWNGIEWAYSYSIGMGDEKYKSELIKYAKKSFPAPNYEGKVGDQVSKFMYIWLT